MEINQVKAEFGAALALKSQNKMSTGMKSRVERATYEASKTDHDNFVLLKEQIKNNEWRQRRNRLTELFPETEAERYRRLGLDKPLVKEEEKFVTIDMEPIIDAVKQVQETIQVAVDKGTEIIWKKPYVSKATKRAAAVQAGYQRRAEEQYQQDHRDKVEDSKKQFNMLQLAMEYLSKPKFAGHHAKAEVYMTDYHAHEQADVELRRQRKKYHQMGLTDVPRKRDKMVIEEKRGWDDVIQEGIHKRDTYIPGRYSNYFGSERIFALQSRPATFYAFKEYVRGEKQGGRVICPEIHMNETKERLELEEARNDPTGMKLRALKSKAEQALLNHVDTIQKKSLYTRLKGGLLDMSRKWIRYNKIHDAGEIAIAPSTSASVSQVFDGEGPSPHRLSHQKNHNHNQAQSTTIGATQYIENQRIPGIETMNQSVITGTVTEEGSLQVIDSCSMILSHEDSTVAHHAEAAATAASAAAAVLDHVKEEGIKTKLAVRMKRHHLKDKSMKQLCVEAMNTQSMGSSLLAHYYDDYKGKQPLQPSLSHHPATAVSNKDTLQRLVTETGRHEVTTRPQRTPFSPYETSTYAQYHSSQQPAPSEFINATVDRILSTPDVIHGRSGNYHTHIQGGHSTGMMQILPSDPSIYSQNSQSVVKSADPSPRNRVPIALLEQQQQQYDASQQQQLQQRPHSADARMERSNMRQLSHTQLQGVYMTTIEEENTPPLTPSIHTPARSAVINRSDSYQYLFSPTDSGLATPLALEMPSGRYLDATGGYSPMNDTRNSTTLLSPHLYYSPVHERPVTETPLLHQDHDYFPQRSIALSLIKRQVQSVPLNDMDREASRMQQEVAQRVQHPTPVRYRNQQAKREYIHYYHHHPTLPTRAQEYPDADSIEDEHMSTAGGSAAAGTGIAETQNQQQLPVSLTGDKKVRTVNHRSNGLTMSAEEFKQYTIANTVQELRRNKEEQKQLVHNKNTQRPSSATTAAVEKDHSSLASEEALRSQYRLENSVDLNNPLKIPMKRMRHFHGLSKHVRSYSKIKFTSTSKPSTSTSAEVAPGNDYDYVQPSKYKFHFISLKKLNLLKDLKK